MQVKDSTRQRINLYLDERDPGDKAILDHLDQFAITRRTSAEVRRLLLLALEMERSGIARPTHRPVGLAPQQDAAPAQPLALPSGNQPRRKHEPTARREERDSTPDELARASRNFIGMFG